MDEHSTNLVENATLSFKAMLTDILLRALDVGLS